MKILSVSHALPSREVSNVELIREIIDRNRNRLSSSELKTLESKIKRFLRFSGTTTRYHRSEEERAADFAMRAADAAIEKAGVNREDIDLLIYAGVGRGWVEPATANFFQSELGLRKATCFDVLDACASWIRSIALAKSLLSQKVHDLIMVLNCEFNYREYANIELNTLDDFENSFSAFTMGEAATATIITRKNDQEQTDDSYFSFRTWGEKLGLCQIPLPHLASFIPERLGEDYLKPLSFFTRPSELLSFTIQKLGQHFSESGLGMRAHDMVFIHAVSVPAVAKVVKILGLDPEKAFETHSRFGNTVSASLPLGMSVALEEGALHRGMQVLLLMGSAGVTTAVGDLTY